MGANIASRVRYREQGLVLHAPAKRGRGFWTVMDNQFCKRCAVVDKDTQTLVEWFQAIFDGILTEIKCFNRTCLLHVHSPLSLLLNSRRLDRPSRRHVSPRASLPACPRTRSCYSDSSWKRSRGGQPLATLGASGTHRDIFYTSKDIAFYVSNFVAMATRVIRCKI